MNVGASVATAVKALLKRRESGGTTEMPFLDHLEELRWRILWSLVALIIGAVIGYFVVTRLHVLSLLIQPVLPFLDTGKLKYLSPTAPFFLTLKLALVIGLILAAPVVIYQLWSFVAPALVPSEKRAIVPSLYLGVVLFAAGVAVAYFLALPVSLRFMMGFLVENLEQSITAKYYLGFVVTLLLAFGLVFELPVVMLVLAVLGVVDSEFLASKRRHAAVISTVVASVITPGDFILLTVFMMVPLMLLYELGIGLAKLVERRRASEAEVSEEAWPQPS